MSAPNITNTAGKFLFDCFQEYRATLPNGTISSRLWIEKADEWMGKWVGHRAVKKAKRAAFTPPTVEEVRAYFKEIDYLIDPQAWCDSYAAKNWCISGSTKMTDWKAAARKWKAMGWNPSNKNVPRDTGGFSWTEPKGWLEFMKETRPNWTALENGEPEWSSLDKDTQKHIIKWMKEGK